MEVLIAFYVAALEPGLNIWHWQLQTRLVKAYCSVKAKDSVDVLHDSLIHMFTIKEGKAAPPGIQFTHGSFACYVWKHLLFLISGFFT